MNYDFTITNNNINKMVSYYKQYLEDTNDSRMLYSFKSPDFKIIIYNSKKVVFQGKKNFEEYEKWCKIFGFPVDKPVDYSNYVNEYQNQRIIGSDEVGTGDFFGPVVVCSAYISPNDSELMNELKIRDSKALTDKQIIEIGKVLVEKVSYHVLVLPPEKYNSLIFEGYNLNKIKAYLHNHALKKLVEKHKDFQNIIVDEFCSPNNYYKYLASEKTIKGIHFHTKGESVHPAVAVASIIARYKFLDEMDKLSEKIKITLPKGSNPSADAIGQLIYLQYGKDIFEKIAKTHFKNYSRIVKE